MPIKRILFILGPLFILLAVFLEQNPFDIRDSIPEASTMGNTPQSAPMVTTPLVSVLRIVDGDTIVIIDGGQEEKVRLIGINAPESVDPKRPVQCFGKEASAHLQALLDGRKIHISYDKSQDLRDKYGRLLAYIFRDDNLFINDAMIREGYAYEYTHSVPYFYQKTFRSAERAAQSGGLGLWAPQTCNGKL